MTTSPLRIYSLPKETFAQIGFPNMLRDKAPEEKSYILERYFADVYALYLNKLSFFVISDPVEQKDLDKLKALFDEIIKIKLLLVDQSIQKK